MARGPVLRFPSMDEHHHRTRIDVDDQAVQRAAVIIFRAMTRGDPEELRRVMLELAVAAAKRLARESACDDGSVRNSTTA